MNSRFLNSATLAVCAIGTGVVVLAIMASQVKFSWKQPSTAQASDAKPLSASDLHFLYSSSPASADERYLGREITVQGIVARVTLSKRGQHAGKWIVSFQTDVTGEGLVGCVDAVMTSKPEVKVKDRYTVTGICQGWEPATQVLTIQVGS